MPVPMYYNKIRCDKGVRVVAHGGVCRSCVINGKPMFCLLGIPESTQLPTHKEDPSIAAARKLLKAAGGKGVVNNVHVSVSDMLWTSWHNERTL